MATLFCAFCANEWEQSLLEVIHCDECELWSAPYVFTHISNDEIAALWQRILAATPESLAESTKGGIYYRTQFKHDLIKNLDLLVLLHEKVAVSEVWEAIEPGEESLRFLEYVNRGLVIPISFGVGAYINEPLAPSIGRSVWQMDPKEIVHKVVNTGFHVDIPERAGYQFVLDLDKIAEVVAYLDLSRGTIDLKKAMRLLIDESSYSDLVPPAVSVGLALKFINRTMILAQLLGTSVGMNPAYETLIRMKLSENSADGVTPLRIFGAYLDELGVKVPQVRTNEVLDFRDTPAAKQFRDTLEKVASESSNRSEEYALRLLREEFRDSLNAFNLEAEKVGKVQVALVSGFLGTVGGVVGGPVGAGIGGVGGAAAGILLSEIYKRIYQSTHSNWAFSFSRWGQRKRRPRRT